MKHIIIFVIFSLNVGVGHSADKDHALTVNCEDYTWSDIEFMVQDYLDDMLFTALVMQGLSSNYQIYAAAVQAMASPENYPHQVKRELQAIIDANC